jgi:hypothetical protein
MQAPKFIKNPLATVKGWASKDKPNEILKAQKMTQEQCDEFNGVKKKQPVKPKGKKPKKGGSITSKLKDLVTK